MGRPLRTEYLLLIRSDDNRMGLVLEVVALVASIHLRGPEKYPAFVSEKVCRTKIRMPTKKYRAAKIREAKIPAVKTQDSKKTESKPTSCNHTTGEKNKGDEGKKYTHLHLSEAEVESLEDLKVPRETDGGLQHNATVLLERQHRGRLFIYGVERSPPSHSLSLLGEVGALMVTKKLPQSGRIKIGGQEVS